MKRTNLTVPNELLAPTIAFLNEKAHNAGLGPIDLWTLLNWMFVCQYWALLYDLGASHPIVYPRNETLPTTFTPYKLSGPVTNNIFINETLFTIYEDFYRTTVLPLLGVSSVGLAPLVLNSSDSVEQGNVSFKMGYSCRQSELKAPLNLIISLLVADLSMSQSMLALVITGAAWVQRKKSKDGLSIIIFYLS